MGAYLAEAWPVLAALSFLGVLTYGALRPYMKRASKTQPTEDDSHD